MKNSILTDIRKRFPCTNKIAEQLFPAFWNEYLISLNSSRRTNQDSEKSNFFACRLDGRNPWKRRAKWFLYLVASVIQVVYFLLQKQQWPTENTIFVFNNLSHKRFFRDDTFPVRLGLYNLRYFKYFHLLQILSNRECVGAIHLALRTYVTFRSNCRRMCEQRGESWTVFRRLTLCGRLHHLDAILHAMAFEKYGGDIHFAGHFEMYVSILSLLREHRAIGRLIGYQHGLFEYAPKGKAYRPLYTDRYFILFPESENWIKHHMITNPNCEIIAFPTASSLTFQALYCKPHSHVIAFGAAEGMDLDQCIINRLLEMRVRMSGNFLIIIYFHPSFPNRMKSAWREQGVIGFNKARHKNIDLFITRYSTLGLDYHRIGVPVLFVPFDDGVCAFESGQFTICSNLDEMELEVRKLFG